MTAKALPLIVEHLSYRYRSREEWALRDVSFQLEPGQVLLIAGASGCGKTTLLRCINGLIPRSYKGGELTGKILLDGQDPAPLVVPDTLRAILSGEEVVDAMDLRAFGSGKRTWYHELHYTRLDLLLIVLSIALFVGSLVAAQFGFGKFWVPGFLIGQ